MHHDGLAQQIAAEKHPVADFIIVKMPGERDFRERPAGLDAQHETEPRANRAMPGVVPSKTFRRPARGVRRQHEIKKLLAIAQTAPQIIPIVDARLDEVRQLLQLRAPDGGLDVERLEIVAEVRINVFVIVALGQFAQLPVKPFSAGVVHAAGAPAIAAPIAETFHDRP